MSDFFSISRWLGIVGKEFIQLKRDRLTFGMIVGIPVIQLILFGFAINSDPKHLPTAALIADRSEFSRSIVAGLRNSSYFEFIGGTNLYRSTSGFTDNTHTTYIGGYQKGATLPVVNNFLNHHPDQHEIAFHPSNPDIWWSTSDGGVVR